MYSEARNDAKLRSLTDCQFRVWFNLMCFANDQTTRGVIEGYDDELLAIEVANGDVSLLSETLERLEKLRIITIDEDKIEFVNWQKRQYDKPSDEPARVRERVKRHRQKTRNANETPCNADVTPCNALDTDTDSETEKEYAAADARVHAREDSFTSQLDDDSFPCQDPDPGFRMVEKRYLQVTQKLFPSALDLQAMSKALSRASPEQIIRAIERVMERKRGDPPRSFKYFEPAIDDIVAEDNARREGLCHARPARNSGKGASPGIYDDLYIRSGTA